MPPDSDNQPPPLIWIATHDAEWYTVKRDDDYTPYVPRTEVDAVWEKAIAVLHEVPRLTIGSRDDYAVMMDRRQLLTALEAARESEKHDGE